MIDMFPHIVPSRRKVRNVKEKELDMPNKL